MAKKKAPANEAEAWLDPGLKCHLTISWLLRDPKGRRTLDAAIRKHVGEEDMYVSDEMEAFLVAYPLDDGALATFEVVAIFHDWPEDLVRKLIPFFDGEDEPFLVQRWDDLARLPNLRRVVGQRQSGIPSPEVMAELPKLETFVISSPDKPKALEKLQAAGFFVDQVDVRTGGWTTLKRSKRGPTTAILATLAKRFPKDVYRKGKGGFILALGQVSFGDGLVARVELTLFRPDEPLVNVIGGGHEGPSADVSLLSAKELAGARADELLTRRIDALFAHVAAERALPARLG